MPDFNEWLQTALTEIANWTPKVVAALAVLVIGFHLLRPPPCVPTQMTPPRSCKIASTRSFDRLWGSPTSLR